LLQRGELRDALLERDDLVLVELQRVLGLLAHRLVAPQEIVLAGGALEVVDGVRDALRLGGARAALVRDRLALAGETVELQRGIADRDEQRERDEREAHERQPEQGSRSPESH